MHSSITGRDYRGLALMLWLGITSITSAQPSVVDANRYDAFWLWAGVASQPALTHARTVYLLDAEVRPGKAALISQRPALPHVQHADVWMVVRVETLDWSPTLYTQVLADLARCVRQAIASQVSKSTSMHTRGISKNTQRSSRACVGACLRTVSWASPACSTGAATVIRRDSTHWQAQSMR